MRFIPYINALSGFFIVFIATDRPIPAFLFYKNGIRLSIL